MLATTTLHFCVLMFFFFAAEGASWASSTHIPIQILSFPFLTIAELTGVMRWAPDSIEMMILVLNSLTWGIASTCCLLRVRAGLNKR